MRSTHRLGATLAALAAILLTAPSSLAVTPGAESIPFEQQTGSVGPYAILDTAGQTALVCRYAGSEAVIAKVVVTPPTVRWPDTNADRPNQKGRIRHVVIVEISTDDRVTWTRVGSSAVQTAVATETTPAALTKRVVSIGTTDTTTWVRVLHRIGWIRADGSVRGTLKHWYAWARLIAPGSVGVQIVDAPCLSRTL